MLRRCGGWGKDIVEPSALGWRDAGKGRFLRERSSAIAKKRQLQLQPQLQRQRHAGGGSRG